MGHGIQPFIHSLRAYVFNEYLKFGGSHDARKRVNIDNQPVEHLPTQINELKYTSPPSVSVIRWWYTDGDGEIFLSQSPQSQAIIIIITISIFYSDDEQYL